MSGYQNLSLLKTQNILLEFHFFVVSSIKPFLPNTNTIVEGCKES